jgi:hypothetical protein
MKPPPDVLFHHDLRLMVWRPRGIVNEKAINKILEFMGKEESASDKPFNRFTDALLVEAVDLNFRYMFHVSLFRRLSYAGPPVKSAILVRDDVFAHYSRLHAILTQGSPLQVRIFQERLKAAKWLGVPLETLNS